MLSKVLGNMGDPIKSWVMMYKVLVQAVLLYGSEIWLVTDLIMNVLEGFHHRIAIRIMGMTARRGDGGGWEWALVDTGMEVTGL